MTDKELSERMMFTSRQVDAAYINTIVELVNACRNHDVKLDKVYMFQNGWAVTFEGFNGDAICHDHSYGSPCYGARFDDSLHTNDWNISGSWETLGFPWDNGDISVHESEWIANALSRLLRGEEYDDSWEE